MELCAVAEQHSLQNVKIKVCVEQVVEEAEIAPEKATLDVVDILDGIAGDEDLRNLYAKQVLNGDKHSAVTADGEPYVEAFLLIIDHTLDIGFCADPVEFKCIVSDVPAECLCSFKIQLAL